MLPSYHVPKVLAVTGASLGLGELTFQGDPEPVIVRTLAAAGALISGVTGLLIYLEKLWEKRRMSDTAPNAATLIRPTALIVLIATLATLPGLACTATPATRLAAAREIYTATLEAAIVARKGGAIDDDQYAQVEAARRTAALLLDQLEAAQLSKFPPTRGQLDAADAAIATFARSIHP